MAFHNACYATFAVGCAGAENTRYSKIGGAIRYHDLGRITRTRKCFILGVILATFEVQKSAELDSR